jgi:AcrR family transcriptional regulator
VTRLTRAESQARTRAQLLETARELFLRDGYLATSIDKVAEAAGFSKGAVYSNFRNKDELCIAVLDQIHADRAAEIAAVLRAPTAGERMRRFAEWAERTIGDPNWTGLELEFAVQARRDERLRQQLADRIGALGELLGAAVEVAADEDDEPPLPRDETALALLCMGVGLGLFRSIDPTVPVSALVNTVRVLAGMPDGALREE